MNKLYLIAHKVRGSAAFDTARHMECPECMSMGCFECDDLGYWWIVPTSGHRAYPWRSFALTSLEGDVGNGFFEAIMSEMPPSLPDHYATRAAPTTSLTEALGLHKPKPQAPILRRL